MIWLLIHGNVSRFDAPWLRCKQQSSAVHVKRNLRETLHIGVPGPTAWRNLWREFLSPCFFLAPQKLRTGVTPQSSHDIVSVSGSVEKETTCRLAGFPAHPSTPRQLRPGLGLPGLSCHFGAQGSSFAAQKSPAQSFSTIAERRTGLRPPVSRKSEAVMGFGILTTHPANPA